MKVFIAGHRGLLGSSLVRILSSEKDIDLVTQTRQELDLTHSSAVSSFFKDTRPSVVVMAAGLVGGIESNRLHPYKFLMTNIQIQASLFDACLRYGVKRIIFFGSSCMYPINCPQPMHESHLWSGPIEPTSKAYAVAKLAGLEMALSLKHSHGLDTISIIPSVMYGPGDNFYGSGHVIPSLIKKFHEAIRDKKKHVTLWGTGSPIRDFVYVDDVARFCLTLLLRYQFSADICNVGSELGVTINDLALTIASAIGYSGEILWDTNRPDGAPAKILDCTIAKSHGWCSFTPLEVGLKITCDWYSSRF